MPQSSAAIQEYLGEFARRARGLSLIGFAFVFITTFMLLVNIEVPAELQLRGLQFRIPRSASGRWQRDCGLYRTGQHPGLFEAPHGLCDGPDAHRCHPAIENYTSR